MIPTTTIPYPLHNTLTAICCHPRRNVASQDDNDDDDDDESISPSSLMSSPSLQSPINRIISTTTIALFLLMTSLSSSSLLPFAITNNNVVNAAPPYAVIAEELGYYPIIVPSTKSGGSSSSQQETKVVQYVPKRIQRHSTNQAIELAQYIHDTNNNNIILAGTYWCSHTSHQKELFGIEAWNMLNTPSKEEERTTTTTTTKYSKPSTIKNNNGFHYIECAPQGYRGNPTICSNLKVDGYPTWIITTNTKEFNNKKNIIRLSGERSLYDIAKAVKYPYPFDATIEDASNPTSGPSACQ